MSNSKFVHLRVCSDASLNHGLMKVKEITKEAKANDMSAVGLMDDMNLFNIVKSYKLNKQGVKQIIGCDILIKEDGVSPYRMGLLCKNDDGVKNLTKLVSKAYDDGFEGETAYIKKEWISEYKEGLIALSSGIHGDVGKCILNNKQKAAESRAYFWKEMFQDDYFIELQRVGRPEDDVYIEKVIAIAEQYEIPVIATNDVHFAAQKDFIAHQVRNAIHEKVTLKKYQETDFLNDRYTPHQYFKSEQDMVELFSDIPEALKNTVVVSKKCTFEMDLGNNYLPRFPTNGVSEELHLSNIAKEGLEGRLEFILDKSSPDYISGRAVYDERLDFELKVISEMGFPGYFLIVADFIEWGRANDVPVGPGRGSGAGSLVAYALGITNLDPIEYELLFERFLNPERVSMPDFDIDFCKERRDDVIKYVADEYGHKSVSQIITFGTFATKASIRDAARALGKPFKFALNLTQKVPDELGVSLEDCLEDATFKMEYDANAEVREVFEFAKTLEGKIRNTGKHAGGVVIADGKITDYCGTYNQPEGGGYVTMLDKNDVEDVGLVKFDFLGLKTLTIINAAVKDVNAQRSFSDEEKLNIDHIDLKDQLVFDTIMKGAQTTAVFQLESAGMKELILRLKPKNFDDIIALVALYRPGPMQAGMVDTFVECKNGLRAVELLHPDLGDVLGGTYGVLIYQEQVMQTAQTLAGFSLGDADMLRRAMGKKKPEEMEKQRSFFVDGCVKNGYDAQEASGIFDSIEKFAGYGFNKSHSAAYALVSYQTAWLKTHYPEHFMSAVLTQDQSELEKVVFYINECKNMKINVMPPDINTSAERFISTDKGEISFSLTAIKGIGSKQVEKIITEREENGPYEDLSDFIVRTNANKKTIESGIKSGLFDSFGETRATMLGSFEDLQEHSRRLKKRAAKKTEVTPQLNMFGGIETNNQEVFVVRKEEMDVMSRLSGERATLGMYVSGHPIHAYEKEIERVTTGKLRDLMELQVSSEEEKIVVKGENKTKTKIRKKNKMVSVVGVIVSTTFKKTFNGDNMAILVIDDGTSQIDATVMGPDFDRLKPVMKEDQLIYIDGSMRWKENIERYSLSSRRAMTMDEMRADKVSHVQFKLGDESSSESTLMLLKEQALNSQRGPSKIELLRSDDGDVSVLPTAFSVKVDEITVNKFKSIIGENNVRVFYKNEKILPSKNVSNADVVGDLELKGVRQKNRKTSFEEAMLAATNIYATR